MASFRKRNGKWYAEIRRQGHYRTGTFATKAQAKYWADDVEADIESGRPVGQHSLAEALRQYAEDASGTKRGARWERLRLNAFERDMSCVHKPIDQVTPQDLADWRDDRLGVVAPSSVRRDFNLLNSVFELARREWRWIRDNPLRDVAKPANPPPRDQIIAPDHQLMIMETAGYWRGMEIRTTQQLTAAAFDLSLETAMRAGEMRSLDGPRIHLSDRYVDLPVTKNGTRRQVPLSKGAVDILSALDSENPFPISASTLDATFRKLRKRAGFDGLFNFHDARATAITRLAKKLDIYELSRMTGHKDLKMLSRYYRETASEIARRLD